MVYFDDQTLKLPSNWVDGLRKALHQQRAEEEGKEYSTIDNHECFEFRDERGEECGVRFSDGFATFGKVKPWKELGGIE